MGSTSLDSQLVIIYQPASKHNLLLTLQHFQWCLNRIAVEPFLCVLLTDFITEHDVGVGDDGDDGMVQTADHLGYNVIIIVIFFI